MTRAERMQPVQRVVDETERQRAQQLGASEARVRETERRLKELEQYRDDYQRAYNERVAQGMSSAGLRDYQVFLARLSEALRQQAQIVLAAGAERDGVKRYWQEAARRSKAIDHVVENWQAEERRSTERREQRDSDERAQRPKPKDY